MCRGASPAAPAGRPAIGPLLDGRTYSIAGPARTGALVGPTPAANLVDPASVYPDNGLSFPDLRMSDILETGVDPGAEAGPNQGATNGATATPAVAPPVQDPSTTSMSEAELRRSKTIPGIGPLLPPAPASSNPATSSSAEALDDDDIQELGDDADMEEIDAGELMTSAASARASGLPIGGEEGAAPIAGSDRSKTMEATRIIPAERSFASGRRPAGSAP